MVIEHVEPGPFALGQEASWGDWENMSTNSKQLFLFDGRWELIVDPSGKGPGHVPFVHGRWPRLLKISEGIVVFNPNSLGRSSTVARLRVHEHQVLLSDCVLEEHGEELHLTTPKRTVFQYRLAS